MDWKDNPHLFANRQFKVQTRQAGGNVVEEFNGDVLSRIHRQLGPYKGAKLIARPKSSITPEEESEIYGGRTDMRILKMLEKGIFPFESYAEESKNIIFKNKDEQPEVTEL